MMNSYFSGGLLNDPSNKAVATLLKRDSGTQSNGTTTFNIISGTSVTPPEGNYVVHFSCEYQLEPNSTGELQLFLNGVAVPSTRRTQYIEAGSLLGLGTSAASVRGPQFEYALTTDGSDTLSVRFRATDGGDSIIGHYTFLLIKLNAS